MLPRIRVTLAVLGFTHVWTAATVRADSEIEVGARRSFGRRIDELRSALEARSSPRVAEILDMEGPHRPHRRVGPLGGEDAPAPPPRRALHPERAERSTPEEPRERHTKEHPQDSTAQLFRAELAWLAGDLRRSTELLLHHRAAIDASDLDGHVVDRLVRGLIRTGRAKEALAVARGEGAAEGFEPWPVLLVLAHAALDDAEAVSEILDGFTPEDRTYYMTEDPDLPGLLERDSMAPVREAYGGTADES